MRKILFVIMLFVVSMPILADGHEPKCGLLMDIVSIEGSEMLGCYRILHLKITNPTDTTAYLPINSQLEVLKEDIANDGTISYTPMGEYDGTLSLEPGEQKTIDIKYITEKGISGKKEYSAHVAVLLNNRYQIIDECFADFDVHPETYREWDLTIDFNIEGLSTEGGTYVLPGTTLNAIVSYTNNEDALYTPTSQLLYLIDYETNKTVKTSFDFRYGYYPSHETYSRSVTFDGLENGKVYYMEIYDSSSFAKVHHVYSTQPFTVSLPDNIYDVSACNAPSVTYDLQGRRVDDMKQKGVYIVNGRKVVR